MEDAPEKKTPRDNYGWFFRGFVADLFGRLLPGILFLVASAVALTWPIHALIRGNPDISCSEDILGAAEKAAGILNASWILLFFIILFLSYVFGHLFYRSEIKEPDRVSLKRMIKNKYHNGSNENPKKDFACCDAETCEYPYPYLGEYLDKRGFKHLLPLVPWAKQGNEDRRSKKYIDILKIRISCCDGESVNTLFRNEAHIRLSSSIWFAASTLCWISLAGLIIIVIAVLTREGAGQLLEGLLSINYYAPALAPAIVLLVAMYCRHAVTESFHEMRVREVVFVLETAYGIFRSKPTKIQDIAPDFEGDNEINVPG
jgi:hypothetical protein